VDTTFRVVYRWRSTYKPVKHTKAEQSVLVGCGAIVGPYWRVVLARGAGDGAAASPELAAPGRRGALVPPRAFAGGLHPQTLELWLQMCAKCGLVPNFVRESDVHDPLKATEAGNETCGYSFSCGMSMAVHI
jgi:hypothetical protein